MLPPPSMRSKWIVNKVAEVKRKLGCVFTNIEDRVEDFFWEIEKRRSWSPKKSKSIFNRNKGGKKHKELRNLQTDINYEKEGRGRNKRRGKRHSPKFVNHDATDNLYLEY